MRVQTYVRKTKETNIRLRVNLDGKGDVRVATGVGFFDHMLKTLALHAGFDLALKAKGDLHVDQHHTVEDCGIALGEAILQALGDRKGINRAGYFCFPMDEALSIVAVDIAGRQYLVWSASFTKQRVGGLETDLVEEFFKGLAQGLKANLHLKIAYGKNEHHKIESMFKAVGKALKIAVHRDPRLLEMVPSTKGLL
jgi:imidazoleglycerol phosphate dehydratase HisB